MPNPLISFCISTKGRPYYIKQLLNAINAQVVRNYEVIVCDNGLEGDVDSSLFDNSIFHYYHNGSDIGMNQSFNRAISLAKGKYVIAMSDDDPPYPIMTKELAELASKYPGYGAYFGGTDILHEDPDIAKFTLHKVGNNSTLAALPLHSVRAFTAKEFPHKFLSNWLNTYIFMSSGMIEREIVLNVGGFPLYGSPFLGDYAYILRCTAKKGCVLLNAPLGAQTFHKTNWGRTEGLQLPQGAKGFFELITKEFSNRDDWFTLYPLIEKFTAAWSLTHVVGLKQYYKRFKLPMRDFKKLKKELFGIPFIKPYRHAYYATLLYIKFHHLLKYIQMQGMKSLQSA